MSTTKFSDSAEFQERSKKLPVFDYVNYRSHTLWPTFSAALNPDSPLVETYEKRAQHPPKETTANKRKEAADVGTSNKAKRQLTGDIFFGPDFNAAAFNCKNYRNLSKILYSKSFAPTANPQCHGNCQRGMPPGSADSIDLRTLNMQPKVSPKSTKKMFEDRRSLIMDFLKLKGAYPTPMDVAEFHVSASNIEFATQLSLIRIE